MQYKVMAADASVAPKVHWSTYSGVFDLAALHLLDGPLERVFGSGGRHWPPVIAYDDR